MKSTGMVRKIDDLGRLVIPMELRRTLEMDEKQSIEFFTEGEFIILGKYTPGCIFCGEIKGVESIFDKLICPACLQTIKRRVK